MMKKAVERSAFGVGAMVAVVGNLPIEPVWLKAIFSVVTWLGGTWLYLHYRPSQDVK